MPGWEASIFGAEVIRRVEAAQAADYADMGRAVAVCSPDRPVLVERLAGGWLVLMGPGLFVNRLSGAGLDGITHEELERVAVASRERGVPPALQLSSWARADGLAALRSVGFTARWFRNTYAKWIPKQDPTAPHQSSSLLPSQSHTRGGPHVAIELVDRTTFPVWQTLHSDAAERTGDARAASDLFCRAAHAVPGAMDFIASIDGIPAAVASLITRERRALLGGAATLPHFRRRGLQALLLAHRVGVAAKLGCDLVVASADVGSLSARNIERASFHLLDVSIGFERDE